jgi:hypothetical protein
MKRALRLIGILLTVCVLCVSLSSCGTFMAFMSVLVSQIDGYDGSIPILERYTFTLTQEDVDEFYEQLDVCEEVMFPDGKNTIRIETELQNLLISYYHIVTQMNVADMHYHSDLDNETFSDNYLFASSAYNDCYVAYMELCQKLYASDSAYKEVFFEDWDEDSIANMLRQNQQMADFEKQVDELLVEYRELEEETFQKSVPELYTRLVNLNHEIALKNGYDNYMDYAYDAVYQRDYTPDDVKQMQEYVKTYMVPLCKELKDNFLRIRQGLTNGQMDQLVALLYDDYAFADNGNLEFYLNSLPDEMSKGMLECFEKNNAIFCDSESSFDRAYTNFIYDFNHPYCYFGPGYQDVFTLAHELGHYYAMGMSYGASFSLDLAEIHSQGNEMLLLTSLNGKIDETVYEALVAYKVFDMACTVILCSIVNEFEEYVYDHVGASVNYDAVIERISQHYGGKAFIEESIGDMKEYWRLVVLEAPAYYISYAMSALPSLEIYAISQGSLEDGIAAYELLFAGLSDAQNTPELRETLADAGLGDPFAESFYVGLKSQLVKEGES